MKKLIAVLGAAAAAVSLAACGDAFTGADVENGKTKFASTCGSCHALADAGTKGLASVGGVPVPNLDDAFRGARQNGWNDSQFQGVVNRWITHAAKPMPRDLVTGADREAVAAYVASVAGRSDESAVAKITPLPGVTPPGGPYPGKGGQAPAGKPTTPGGGSGSSGSPGDLTVDADPGGNLAFTQTTLEAPAGTVRITLKNDSAVPHSIAVKGGGVSTKPSETVEGGKTVSISVDLKPGEYEFYCAVPGHEQAGMKGTLTVK